MTPDLRGFLDSLRAERPQDVWEIAAPVSHVYEMTAFALELERRRERPVLFFREVEGYDAPVLSNLFASRPRIGFMLGLDERELVTGWARVAARRLRPVQSDVAPVKDVVVTG